MIYVIVIALVFLICFLLDKGFTKLFRSKPQHRSGLSVRLSKYYGVGGLVLCVLAVAAFFTGFGKDWVVFIGGILILLVGIGLCVYYLGTGIYYNEDGFLYSSALRKSVNYRYGDIQGQLLYKTQGNAIIVELHMKDGKAIQVLSGMAGYGAFLDKAYVGWLQQTGRDPESCDFHDPSNSCWFPTVEG